MKKIIALISIVILVISCENSTTKEETKAPLRVVSLNGTLTEILFALKLGDSVVGVDVTSVYPKSTEKMMNLGHITQINRESLFGLKPTHIIAFEDEMNVDLSKQIKDAKIQLITYKRELSVQGTKKLIEQIASDFGGTSELKTINQLISEEAKTIQKLSPKPKVLFIYARGAGMLMAGGNGTPVEKVIQLAGAENAAKGFKEYKPLTTEALTAFNPDVILMFESGAQSLGPDGIWSVPGMSLTNAGKNKKLITMDGLLLSGFGPRVGQAIQQLNKELNN